jgi:probable rRNA maturation factor
VKHNVHVSSEDVRVPLAAARVRYLVTRVLRSEGVPHAMVSIAFVSTRAIRSMNRRHLGRSTATDVIAFGMSDAGENGAVIGDIYIAPEVARSNAVRLRTPVRLELARLVVHGTLHALGYDHPEGNGRLESAMWRRQELLLKRLLKRPPGRTRVK